MKQNDHAREDCPDYGTRRSNLVKRFVNKLRTVSKQFGKVQDKMEEGSC